MDKYVWYGKYKDNGKSFEITKPDTPRHWYNYFFNDDYVSFTSQVGFGEGFAQDDLGRRIPVVSNRNVFVSENGKSWSICGLPIKYGYTRYSCVHKNGSSTINLKYRNVESSFRIFVPNHGMCEIWSVTLKNCSDEDRQLDIVSYAKTEIDGTYKPQGYNTGTGGFDKKHKVVWGRSFLPFYTTENRPVRVYMGCSDKITGFDSRRNAFIGTYGDEQHPYGITSGLLTQDTDCNSEKICLVLKTGIKLMAHEEKTVHFTIGTTVDENSYPVFKASEVDRMFREMEDKYNDVLSGVEIHSPWKNFDYLINGWMKYCADMGSRWARVRHNGYRDMTSDTECFGCVNPKIAWERLKRVLSYQYSNGYAPRTIIDGAIRDRNFSDNTVWMTFAADSIVKEIGDVSLYNDVVKFNDGSEAPVYEHLKRSVEFLYNFQGLYGLVRIWGGDWNDCVNFAGLKGKGVSVWLSLAWYRAARTFVRIAKSLGREEDAKMVDEQSKIMQERIEKYGWDGEYYIYARTDDDIILGSKTSEAGEMYLIPQLWAVLSGVSETGREKIAMDSVEKYLEIDLGTRLSYHAFTHRLSYIGSCSEKPAGCQDNGGVYLHCAAWKLACDSILKRPEMVEKGLRKMLPWDTTYAVKCGEPYAMFNSYFAPECGYREGTPGQSWRTAASSWLLKSTVEYVFGMHPELEGLRIDPCLPPSWNNCSITKVFRGCKIDVSYKRTGKGCEVKKITVDGKTAESNIINPNGKKKLKVDVEIG